MQVIADNNLVDPNIRNPNVKKGMSRKKKILLIGSIVGFIICIGLAVYILMGGGFEEKKPAPVVNTTPVILPYNTSFRFDIGYVSSAYDQRLVKITHDGGDKIENMVTDLYILMYPPEGTPYIARLPASYDANMKYTELKQGDALYFYMGIDQAPHVSKEIPSYDQYIDFPDGKWSIHIEDRKHNAVLTQYDFDIFNSRTRFVKSDSILRNVISDSYDYDTIIVDGNGAIYHDQLIIERPLRMIGTNMPIIDAGGSNPVVTIQNTTDVMIDGFRMQNSGLDESTDAGILVTKSSKVLLKNNHITENQNGIYLYNSNDCSLLKNTIFTNEISGIIIGDGSNRNIVSYNSVQINTFGIYIKGSADNNYVSSNTGFGNTRYGILVDNKLRNVYEYNDFGTDEVSYDQNYVLSSENLTVDYSNDGLWGTKRKSNSTKIWGTPGPEGKDFTDYS